MYLNLCILFYCLWFFFFFQAEDGIRDRTVTGVQTCAIPIYAPLAPAQRARPGNLEAHRRHGLDEPLDRDDAPASTRCPQARGHSQSRRCGGPSALGRIQPSQGSRRHPEDGPEDARRDPRLARLDALQRGRYLCRDRLSLRGRSRPHRRRRQLRRRLLRLPRPKAGARPGHPSPRRHLRQRHGLFLRRGLRHPPPRTPLLRRDPRPLPPHQAAHALRRHLSSSLLPRLSYIHLRARHSVASFSPVCWPTVSPPPTTTPNPPPNPTTR